jgi:hypothetical protein
VGIADNVNALVLLNGYELNPFANLSTSRSQWYVIREASADPLVDIAMSMAVSRNNNQIARLSTRTRAPSTVWRITGFLRMVGP